MTTTDTPRPRFARGGCHPARDTGAAIEAAGRGVQGSSVEPSSGAGVALRSISTVAALA
jgi:hypothetical protein